MTKYATNKKALKAVMAGAIAFTPVLAVSVEAESSNLTTGEISKINEFYTSFNTISSVDKKELIRITLKVIGENPTLTLESAYSSNTTLTTSYQNLLSYSSLSDISETSLQNNYSTFKTSVASVKSDVTSAELVTYYGNIINGLTTAVNGLTTTDMQNLSTSEFYNQLAAVYLNNTTPGSLVDVVKLPSTSIIDSVQTDFNSYLASKPTPTTPPPTPPPTPGPTPPATPVPVGEVISDSGAVESNPQSVIDAIQNATTVNELVVELKANVDSVSIPVTILNALATKNSSSSIVVSGEGSSYSVPVGLMNVTDIAAKLGVASSELKMVVNLEAVATNPLTGKAGVKVLSNAVDFKLSFVAPDGESLNLSHFARPVQRSLTANADLNPLTTVGVVVHADGSMSAVPTFVSSDNKGANLYRNSNSVYTLIENSKTFIDVDKGASWAEEYVEKLASRMVVNGVTSTTYKPTQMINRGEFAAILARGLGLVAENADANVFSDVSLNQAFNKNGEISAVVEAGLVKGFDDKKFRPYEEITRDEAAIMISRAIDYIDSDLVVLDTTKKVSSFGDYKYIGSTARTHVDKVYKAGYLDGFKDNTFRPGDEANRAQMAKILYNFLESIEFIN